MYIALYAMKISVLVNGWINIPHSYAIVNCMQLIHLYKNHKDQIDIYVQEPEYYGPSWSRNSQSLYNDEYTEILQGLRPWNGEHIDLIYSICFPYDVTNSGTTPKCVFYTCELQTMDNVYFKPQFANNQDIKNHLNSSKQLYLTTPSIWSGYGMEKTFDIPTSRNRLITHGSDTNIFKPVSNTVRDATRQYLGVSNDTILLGMFGSMTQNKGIHLLLKALYDIVIVKGKTNYKLLLKGSNNLYESQKKVEQVFKENEFPQQLLNNIIFIGHTFTFSTCNELYNIVDLYVSPYMAEGFNLSPLEALTAGRRVLIPRTGSTEQYMNDIYNNGGADFITYVNSVVVSNLGNQSYNHIEEADLISAILSVDTLSDLDPTRMIEYISKSYSWNRVADLLYEYFLYILEDQKTSVVL
jgi:glycosyltransferase involved in cell wall biosynthesis